MAAQVADLGISVTSLRDAVVKALKKLDDEGCAVWAYDEMVTYIKDGYNQYCRLTKCLFDMWVIDNVPQTGNWTTDLERYFASLSPGMGLTDSKLNFTAEFERDLVPGGLVSGSTEGPVNATSPGDTPHLADFGITSKVATGRVPPDTVDIHRITWDELRVDPEDSAQMRVLDEQYEKREGGDPRHYTMDKDGLFTIRFVPPARGDAVYNTVDGSRGTMRQTSDADISTQGTWGIFRCDDQSFPANGPWGTPTRQHPRTKNIIVERARLGKSLDHHPFELPDALIKFVIFWAMSRALARAGEGQDLKLSKHFSDRFDMGVSRGKVRLRKIQKEKVLKMGASRELPRPFDMGDPQAPYPYGKAGKRLPDA